MKRMTCIRLIACLLLAALTVGCLASCMDSLPEDKRAVKVYQRAEMNSNRASSNTMVVMMRLSFTVSGEKITIDSVTTGKTERKHFLRTVSESITTVSGGGASTVHFRTEGYMDGKAFFKGDTAGLWSEMTPMEYAEWQASNSETDTEGMSTLLPAPEKVAEKSCTKDAETGEYTVTMKGIGKDNLTYFAAGMKGLSDMMGDVSLDDVDLTFLIDKNMRFKQITAEYRFSGEGMLPEATMEMKMSDWNNTKVEDIENFDKQYKQVEDIRFPGRVAKAYNDAVEQANLTIEAASETTFMGQQSQTSETDHIAINTEDGYSFTIEANPQTDPKNAMTLTYKNGMITTTDLSGQIMGRQNMTESEAKSYIRTLTNPIGFADTYVSDVSKNTSNDRLIEMPLTSEALQATKDQLKNGGINVGNSSGTLTAELDEDGAIQAIFVRMEFAITISDKGAKDGKAVINYALYLYDR